AQKGIAGRGVLLDWGGWMDFQNINFDAFTVLPRVFYITQPGQLDAVAEWQGLDPASFTKPGDFLVVRTGFTKQYTALSAYEQAILPFREGADVPWVGMEVSDASLSWL
ncbi:hypothetical protein DFH07DRAFT_753057, partial [Mycena maculata]